MTSLFGGQNNGVPQTKPLFPSNLSGLQSNQPQQQQQQQLPNNGLNSILGSSGFGLGNTINGSANNQQNGENPVFNAQNHFQAGLGNSTAGNGLTTAQQQELARSRLHQVGFDTRAQTKPVIESARTLIAKFDPNSQDTLLQSYLYNAVNSAYAPFYHRNVDEDEKSWEAALAEKPPNTEIDGISVSYVPVLVRGFKALGERVEYQANIVNEMRRRLHEMNNSLSAVMAAHEQKISVKIEAARRQHTALSQRCLRLAVKVQILRNRGYALDSSEEALRKTLQDLERNVMDPGINGREEEIWARMVALRERSRWLEEEGKRLGRQVEQQEQQHPGLPDHVVQKARKILQDYENQIAHLSKELEDVKKEYVDWNDSQQAKSSLRR